MAASRSEPHRQAPGVHKKMSPKRGRAHTSKNKLQSKLPGGSGRPGRNLIQSDLAPGRPLALQFVFGVCVCGWGGFRSEPRGRGGEAERNSTNIHLGEIPISNRRNPYSVTRPSGLQTHFPEMWKSGKVEFGMTEPPRNPQNFPTSKVFSLEGLWGCVGARAPSSRIPLFLFSSFPESVFVVGVCRFR